MTTLETDLGVKLLERTPDGYLLTATGETVRVQAERIEADTQSLIRSAVGTNPSVQGQVRIACTESLATHVLAPRLGDFHVRHPGMLLEIIPHVERMSLAMREADIAIQFDRPDKNDLVTKRIGYLAFGLYASHAYVEKIGGPDFSSGCVDHAVMTLAGNASVDMQSDWVMSLAYKACLGLKTSSLGCLVAATGAGGGLACLPRYLGDRQVRLRLIKTPNLPPKAEIWMLVHNDNRRSPRIVAVVSAIADAFKSYAGSMDPR